MCTVTYIPLGKNDFILTSNRDENPLRKTIAPKTYSEDGVALTYPKDELAGGTWIGVSDKNRLICLLNGGYTIHKRASSYKESRGVIVKRLLKADDAVTVINEYNFEGIEPFTIVLVDWQNDVKAYELVWTGEEKSFQLLENAPKMWSSATLYDKEMKAVRQTWFEKWLATEPVFNQKNILSFHQQENKEMPGVSIKMKRDKVETVSVTSMLKEGDAWGLKYLDFFE